MSFDPLNPSSPAEFYDLAQDNLEKWKLIEGRSVQHCEKGIGVITKLVEVTFHLKIRLVAAASMYDSSTPSKVKSGSSHQISLMKHSSPSYWIPRRMNGINAFSWKKKLGRRVINRSSLELISFLNQTFSQRETFLPMIPNEN